jgi:VanZ family protein
MNLLTKKQYKILFFIATTSVLLLALIPNGGGINISTWDKANHFIAFFTLSFLLNRASSTINARIRNMLSLLGFGMSIEIFQAFTSYRASDINDIFADGVGILAFQLSLSLYRLVREFRASKKLKP